MTQTTRVSGSPVTPWRGSSLVFAAELLLLPTGLITAGYLTRQLGADGYGLLTLAATVVGWLQWVANSMLARAAHRMVAGTAQWRPVAAEVIRLHFQVGLLLGATLLVSAPLVAAALHQPVVVTPLRVLAFDLPLYALACGYRNVLIGTNDHRTWALGSALRWTVRLVAIIAFVRAGWGITGAVLGMMTANAAELLVGRRRIGPLARGVATEVASVRRALLDAVAPVAVAAVAMRTFDRADLLLLSLMHTSAATLGHYGAAQNLTVIVSLVASSVAPAVLASIASYRRTGDDEGARRVAFDALRVPFVLLPFSTLAAASAPDITRVIYGIGFAEAAAPFAVLMFAATALLMVTMATGVLVAADRAWHVVVITIPMLLALIVLSLVLVPRYGSVGAAMAALLAASAAAVVSLHMARRAMQVAFPWRSLLIGGGLAVPVWYAARALPTLSLVGTAGKLGALATVLGALLLAGNSERRFAPLFTREGAG